MTGRIFITLGIMTVCAVATAATYKPTVYRLDYGTIYPVKIDRVKDGDTFVGVVKIWEETFIRDTFRLYGVNTPETWVTSTYHPDGTSKTAEEKFNETAPGRAAKAFVERALMNTLVYVKPRGRGKHGHVLVEVYFENPDPFGEGFVNLTEFIIGKGFGVPYIGK